MTLHLHHLIAEFQLAATEEIKAWVLSFGTKAEVLEPESLRMDVLQDIELLAKRYRPHRPRRAKPLS